jgi:hypothetical protein
MVPFTLKFIQIFEKRLSKFEEHSDCLQNWSLFTMDGLKGFRQLDSAGEIFNEANVSSSDTGQKADGHSETIYGEATELDSFIEPSAEDEASEDDGTSQGSTNENDGEDGERFDNPSENKVEPNKEDYRTTRGMTMTK